MRGGCAGRFSRAAERFFFPKKRKKKKKKKKRGAGWKSCGRYPPRREIALSKRWSCIFRAKNKRSRSTCLGVWSSDFNTNFHFNFASALLAVALDFAFLAFAAHFQPQPLWRRCKFTGLTFSAFGIHLDKPFTRWCGGVPILVADSDRMRATGFWRRLQLADVSEPENPPGVAGAMLPPPVER